MIGLEVKGRAIAVGGAPAGAGVRRRNPWRDRGVAAVEGGVAPDESCPNRRPADPAQRLRWHQLPVGIDDRKPGEVVPPVEREPGQDLAAEERRADAVAREAEAVVNSSARAEDGQMGGGDVDRPAPGVGDPAPVQLREHLEQIVFCRGDRPRVEVETGGVASAEPIRPPPQPKAIRPSRVVRR